MSTRSRRPLWSSASIQTQITLWAGLCLALAAGGVAAYAAVGLRQSGQAALQLRARAVAELQAERVAVRLGSALMVARGLATIVAETQSSADPGQRLSRAQADALVRATLSDNPQLAGVFMAFEPDAFDAQDAVSGEAVGSETGTGRFMPAWSRDDRDNSLHGELATFQSDATGSDYACPKTTLTACASEPHVVWANGRQLLLTALTVPIVVDGQFRGVSGVAVPLALLQSAVDDAAHGFGEEAQVAIITYAGTLAALTDQPLAAGKSATLLHDDLEEEDLGLIQSGDLHAQVDEGRLAVFAPIRIGDVSHPWSVNLLVPMAKAEAEANSLMWQMIAFGGALAAVGLAFLWLAAGFIARPIRAMAAAAAEIAQTGHTGRRIDVRRGDEVGQMARALQALLDYLTEMGQITGRLATGDLTATVHPRSEQDTLGRAVSAMVTSFRGLVGDIRVAADTLNDSSNRLSGSIGDAHFGISQIAASIQQSAQGAAAQTGHITHTADAIAHMKDAIQGLARGAQDQARAIARSADLTTQINEAIGQVADSAVGGARDSADAAALARVGTEAVTATVQDMLRIQAHMGTLGNRIEEMDRRSGEVGAIIETIEDLASQTSLLALNAAIEAARAGEHGRGFAVVSDEVRKLAERSATSAGEIRELVQSIQAAAHAAVAGMRSGVTEIESGVRGANNSGRALTTILDNAQSVHRQIDAIAAAATRIRSSATDLAATMASVSEVVEQNTAGAIEMSDQADQVSTATESVAAISEENTAAVEEVSAATEQIGAQMAAVAQSSADLTRLAARLRAAVAVFQLAAAPATETVVTVGAVVRDRLVV